MSSNLPNCAHCQAPLARAGARFCPSCGREQPTRVQSAGAAPPTVGLGPTLQVQEEGQMQIVALGPKPVSLGRAADNDLVLSSRFVSGHHARIEPTGQGHRIVDVGSTNGMLFAGQRIGNHELADGDAIRIGDPATGSFVTLTYRNPMVARTPQAGQVSHRYELDPNDPQITIGRVGCDITLDNPQVSRFHAQIDRTPAGLLLRDAGSSNGTFVNGQRLTSTHPLKPGDVIQIGAFKFVYSPGVLAEYDQRGAMRIDAHAISRTVRKGSQSLTILQEVSMGIAPREFVALVGGSGTGKSTLMKALCGYAPANGGRVLVNGDDFYRNFASYRDLLGYVPQDDILHQTLPVDRALRYAARLRLPADTASSELGDRVNRVLDDVEMGAHRTKMIESLSGGQRKRVSIGAELLADPSLFFLDEPTSGLDPGLEKKMMYTLRQLADSGRTVVLVTHATANITVCDHVVFMAAGRMVYFGPPTEALGFFNVTSGDFADIYTRLEGPGEANNPIVQRELQAEYAEWQQANPQAQGPPTLAELWERKYRKSPQYRRYVAERLAETPPGPVVRGNDTSASVRKDSPIRQFILLTRRYLDLTLQDRRNLMILLFQAPLIALLLLLVARSDALTGAQAADLIQRGEAKKVLFMLATVSVWFGIINSAREIVKEEAIYQRERLVNLRIVPYIGSKVTVLSLLILVQTLLMLGVVALRIDFFADTGLLFSPFVETFITLMLTSFAGMALGLVISAFSASGDRAISIVPLALIPQILFAGLIFNIEGFATPLSWLTISRWAMDALGTSFDLNSLCNMPNLDNRGSVPPGCTPAFLSSEDSFTYTAGHLLSRWTALIAFSVACLGLTGWGLKKRDRVL
ncbi:FHA domain-containing protein [Candidatus Viridilinea mediisalina]|uniref:ABC transporter ATP-binding protein n=1 Tax=Candidatus Viridilinea mediisalina TaxID=2024553 RepID=A0A2A6RLL7_9CHLR|nr:FHA domain-containing protein [Candidatus Viridilinea mediisalina]PDW03801.1 ABC transporter ATP-binding protein [Candidatus Viridilinea mediisalina]